MAKIVYFLCAILSLICTYFLFRGFRTSRSKLLLWSCLAFAMLSVNNLILFADLVVFPSVEFDGSLLRSLSGAVAGSLLVYGLIWEVT